VLIKLKNTKNIFNFQRKNDDWDFNTASNTFSGTKLHCFSYVQRFVIHIVNFMQKISL
jgi:hypothetical protein